MDFFFYFSFVLIRQSVNNLEHLQQIHQIFVLFGEWTVLLPFIYPLFQIHFLTDSLSYSLSHLNIISSFIISSFFNNYTSSNIFYSPLDYYNRKKKNFWRINSSPSNLMSYCLWAKKISKYRVGECFYGPILYYREFYAFAYAVEDALSHSILLYYLVFNLV